MKSHIQLLDRVLNDLGTWCSASTTRDLNTITRRLNTEGLSFLTITLPAFCRDFERCLDRGKVARTDFAGYAKSGCLPKIFSGFTGQVFDRSTGVLLDDPSIEAIRAVRQITLMYSKIDLPCSDARVRTAIEKFVECEQQVRFHDARVTPDMYQEVTDLAERLFGKFLVANDLAVIHNDVFPKHGPGSTADKLLGNAKFDQTEWTERLERVFLYQEYLYPNLRSYISAETDVTLLEPGAERPVRVITVPKTLKTPRIIAIEPTCMQFMQQGLLDVFLRNWQRDDILCQLIGFNDQGPNQDLALEGSLTGELATLDLSEASDRVSNQLVRRLFAKAPLFAEALDATRSRKADVPGHGVLRLAKFASMGSALCFPVEAFAFICIVLVGIQRELNIPLSRGYVYRHLLGQVRVYGDDIVVPAHLAETVVATLQDFGLEVNVNKSFWTGRFRESCGKEYYDGHDVTVVRLRHSLPTRRQHVPELVGAVSFRNQAYFAGLWGTATFMDSIIRKLIPFPDGWPSSPGLVRHTVLPYEEQRMCPNLQRPLVKAAVVVAQLPESKLEGSGALLKYFLKRGPKPFADERHLERAGRPDAVYTKLRYVTPY